jgi:hypothetical protein
MLLHIIAVIAATSSDLERNFAKGLAPLTDNTRHSGASTKSAIKADLNAGAVMTS